MDYLAVAAQQLEYAAMHARTPEDHVRMAEAFAMLAAIERGIVPPAMAEAVQEFLAAHPTTRW